MSAASAQGQPPGDRTDGDRRHEPSMEEILASIRRIIADDQVLPLSLRTGQTTDARPERKASLLPIWSTAPQPLDQPGPEDKKPAARLIDGELLPEPHDDHAEPPSGPEEDETAWSASGAAARPDVAYDEPQGDFDGRDADDDRSEPVRSMLTAPREDSREPDMIHAGDAADALISSQAGASVAASFNVLAATTMVQNLPPIEDLARDMLRPMLKSWLDDNLPVLVERLVRAEIERVARGGR